ncbi:hypothetical protein GE115_11170 [Agromyces sp. CFH 90414]|uniref:ATP-binding protein n=1 Tax=Agromyces agglutinans TaxID=2662258 RepID=A0A6I2F7Y2_9MICO|nr:hypothetical protein [Agromyces agglutinans]MRG60421.1 hypothetical protein [Agromyces agglutinans]
MALGLPEHLARDTLSHGLNRAAQAAALVCLLAAIGVAITSALTGEYPERWWVVLGCLAMAGLLALVAFLPSVLTVIAFLAAGAGVVFMATTLVLTPDSMFPDVNNPLIGLPLAAMVLVGGPGAGTWTAVAWTLVAYLAGEAAVFAGGLTLGHPWAPSLVPTFALVIVLIVRAYDGLTRRGQPRRRTGLHQASQRARDLSLRHDFELRATARLNDIALSHLVEIAASGSGQVDERLRAGIRRDLSLIVGRDWAIDHSREAHTFAAPDGEAPGTTTSTLSRPDPRAFGGASDAASDALPGTEPADLLPEAFEAAATAGVTVQVTGDLGVVAHLTPERRDALDGAVAQCLVNVGRHAGVGIAEIVAGSGGGEVTIAVIDEGDGFDPAGVPADRIGIRISIQARLEQFGGTVRLWSTAGIGTTVVLTLPMEGRS